MLSEKEKKTPQTSGNNTDRAEKTRKKAASAGTNEESVAAELKNREHGHQQPAR
ncbi:MAG: hypothetical protein JWP78_1094 [Mucilaginibacter sp.]|nr:hypothetical protein [Mucilaginibacter sp.]